MAMNLLDPAPSKPAAPAGFSKPLFALILGQTVSGKQPIGDFFKTIDEIEKQTGLDFLSGLPDNIEDRIEAARPDAGWNPDLELNGNKKFPEPLPGGQ